jgi:hypothetical protein
MDPELDPIGPCRPKRRRDDVADVTGEIREADIAHPQKTRLRVLA